MRYFIFLVFFSIVLSSTGIDSTEVKNPAFAWKCGLIPGMGQIYNGDYLKSGLFLSMGTYAVIKREKYKELNQLGKRNTYTWWAYGLYFLSILDAYVDAHLSTFPVEKNSLKDKN